MAYDYSKLQGRIVEKYGTQGKFASALGLSEHSLSKKLTGQTHFKQQEITKSCDLLGIAVPEMHEYFFTMKVQ